MSRRPVREWVARLYYGRSSVVSRWDDDCGHRPSRTGSAGSASGSIGAGTPNAEKVRFGLLMSYGQDVTDALVKTASYVDKILKGAHPTDLPFEQPTRLKLVINLEVAKALNLIMPPTLLASADEVIE